MNGLPVIAAKDNLTIVGNGDTIERSTAVGTPLFRLLDVASGGSLTLENLTLQGGHIPGPAGLRDPSPAGPDCRGERRGHLQPGYARPECRDSSEQRGRGQTWAGVGRDAAGGGIFSYYGAVTLEGGTIVQNNEAEGGAHVGTGG